jgi:DNA-directed RNA polymerase subunit K/omega
MSDDEGVDVGDYDDVGDVDEVDEVEPAGDAEGEGDASDDKEGVDEPEEVDDPESVPEELDVSKIVEEDPPQLDRSGAEASRPVLVVAPDERMTSNVLQASETARVIGVRAEQVSRGSPYFGPTSDDAITVARDELYAKRCPLILRRQVGVTPDGRRIVEDWDIREMVLTSL